MPWESVDRLVGQYDVAKRDVETLVGLDEYEGKGLQYYEEVTGGEAKIGKKALNWYVVSAITRSNGIDTCVGSCTNWWVNCTRRTRSGRRR